MNLMERGRPARRGLSLFVLVMFVTLVLNHTVGIPAAWADSAREELANAETYFFAADFERALAKVEEILRGGQAQGEVLRDAYLLKARCEVGLDRRGGAGDSFCRALAIDPDWGPDPDFYTTDEIAVFEEARASCQGEAAPAETVTPAETPPPTQTSSVSPLPPPLSVDEKPWYKKPVFLALIGGAVIGGVVLAMSGGDDETTLDDLPGFPAHP